MNIKILQNYLELCRMSGTIETPEGYCKYVELFYPEMLKKLDRKQMDRLVSNIKVVDIEFIKKVIDTSRPRGLFIAEEGEGYTAVDNTGGDAWTENFKHKHIAVKWLNNDLDTDEAYLIDQY